MQNVGTAAPGKKMSALAKTLLSLIGGAGAGAGVGIGAGVAHRVAANKSIDSPESTFEMPVAMDKRSGVGSAVLGAGVGLPLGFKATTTILDKLRAKKLSKMLADRDNSLNSMLTEEQSIAKQGSVEDALRKVAGMVYDSTLLNKSAATTGSVQSLVNELKSLPSVQKYMLGTLAGVSGLAGVSYGARRAASSDKGIAQMRGVSNALTERLREGDLRAPMVLKVRQPEPNITPLRPGASSRDPSVGRDALAGI